MANLNGQVALVTGASRGIGRAIALRMAEAGADLVLAARSQPQLQAVAAAIEATGQRAAIAPTDVASEAGVARLVQTSLATFGRIDILVNNAGINYHGPLLDSSVADFDRVMGINLRGPYLCIREVLPHMVARRSGLIINVLSRAVNRVYEGGGLYLASKAGLLGLTKVLAREAQAHNVRVVALFPGQVDTAFGRKPEGHPDHAPYLKTDEVAALVVALASLPPGAVVSQAAIESIRQPLRW